MDICKWWICYRLQLISILQSNFSEKWYIQENVWFSQIFQKIIPIFEKTSRILCNFRKRRNRFNTILIRKMEGLTAKISQNILGVACNLASWHQCIHIIWHHNFDSTIETTYISTMGVDGFSSFVFKSIPLTFEHIVYLLHLLPKKMRTRHK